MDGEYKRALSCLILPGREPFSLPRVKVAGEAPFFYQKVQIEADNRGKSLGTEACGGSVTL